MYALLSSADPAGMRLSTATCIPTTCSPTKPVSWLSSTSKQPAEPARDLAFTLVSCFHDGDPDLASMRRAYRSYVAASRTGADWLEQQLDVSVYATRLNFLNVQVRVALDSTNFHATVSGPSSRSTRGCASSTGSDSRRARCPRGTPDDRRTLAPPR